MSIKKGFNPNAGDRTYRIILKRSLSPNNNNQTDYSDSGHDYSDDAPDYSNYQDYSPDQGYDSEDTSSDDVDENQDDDVDDDSGENGDGSKEDQNKNNDKNKNKQNNRDDSRNKLRNAEHNYGGSNSNRRANSSSLAKRERSSGGGKFKYSSSKSGGRRGGGFKGFMSQHKSGVLTGLSGTFVFGGMMSGSMLLSGPAQFLQIMHFISNTYNTVRELQSTLRESKNMKSVIMRLKNNNAALDDKLLLKKYGEVGLLSSRSSTAYAQHLAKNGIHFELTKNDIKMFIDHKQFEVDWGCGPKCVAQQMVNKLGGKIDDYKIDLDNKSIEVDLKKIRNSGGLFKEHNLRKFFAKLGRKTGMNFWSRWSGQRAFARATNIVYGFHPFVRAKELAKDSIKDLGKKLMNTKIVKKATTKTYEIAVKLYNKTRMLFKNITIGGYNLSLPKVKDPSLQADREGIQDSMNSIVSQLREESSKITSSIRNSELVSKFGGALKKGIGIIALVTAIICLPVELDKNIEKIRWMTDIMPAIQLSIEVIATAGQMMAGRMSMAQLSVMSRKQFYDDNIPDPDHPGKFTSSSWWDSAPVNAELGLDVNDAKTKKVPSAVQKASDGSFLRLILDTLSGGHRDILQGVCDTISTQLFQIVQAIADVALDVATGGATLWVAIAKVIGFNVILPNILQPLVSGAAEQTVSWLSGAPLDITNQLPAQFGDITAYGSKFNQSQNGLHDSGGAVLSDKAAAEVNRQKNVWLAEEWNDKPLLAKLFDPTDYRSGLGTLARNARLNPNPETILASISNTFKLLAAVPSTAVSLAVNSPAQTALAASGAQKYNYDVDEIAIPPSTLDAFTQDGDENGNDDKDEFSNAEKVMDIFHSDAAENEKLISQGKLAYGPEFAAWRINKTNYKNLTHVCLAKDIDDDGIVSDDIETNAENGGFTFMYIHGNSSDKSYINNNCAGKLDRDNPAYDETLARIAMYVGPDVSRARATECLGDPKSPYTENACVGAGLAYKNGNNSASNVGGDVNNNSGPVITDGNQDADKMVQLAKKEIGGNNVFKASGGSYQLSVNWCVTIPAWFISYHTDLNYCNGACGNGGDIVQNLAKANGLKVTKTVTKAPAIFSNRSGDHATAIMCGNEVCGHTGLVTAVYDDGSIDTVEVINKNQIQKFHKTKKEYTDAGFEFVYIGDHLKGNIPKN